MKIGTSIDWSYFSRFLTEKTKRIMFIMAMIILYVIYDCIEWAHHSQMRIDNFWTTWSWILAIPTGLLWIYGELKNNISKQIIGCLLFIFLGPVLSMGVELRNIHIFSPFERMEMLVCTIVGLTLFALYIRSKLYQW